MNLVIFQILPVLRHLFIAMLTKIQVKISFVVVEKVEKSPRPKNQNSPNSTTRIGNVKITLNTAKNGFSLIPKAAKLAVKVILL